MGLLCNEKVENLLLDSNSTIMDLPKYPSSSSSSTTKRAHHDQDLQQENHSEPLDCPRCGSKNTKFCYYNNYNKSQPRHFCKACKRHWTKGGTLRNVPVGGCRKNKRLKTSGGGSDKSAAAAVVDTVAGLNTSMMYDQDCHDLYLADEEGLKAFSEDDQKSISSLLFDAFMENNSNRNFSFSGIDSLPFEVDGGGGGGNRSSSISGIQDKLHNVYYDHCSNNSQPESLESSSTTVTLNNGVFYPPWKSGGMAAEADYWNLNDLDALISADINVPWDDDDDDEEINP